MVHHNNSDFHNVDDVMSCERIIEMINQIDDFFKPYPEKRRIEGIRNHLKTYWDPRMRNQLINLIDSDKILLSPSIVNSVQLLKEEEFKPGYYGPPKI